VIDPHKRSVAIAMSSLLASSATLVCCVLPAVLVSLGAGAALIGLISAFPQLVWLSQHKEWVFAGAGILLLLGGLVIWNTRRLPCPADPLAARTCTRLRRTAEIAYAIALSGFLLGALFAFLL
jgi:hypothetical protein